MKKNHLYQSDDETYSNRATMKLNSIDSFSSDEEIKEEKDNLQITNFMSDQGQDMLNLTF